MASTLPRKKCIVVLEVLNELIPFHLGTMGHGVNFVNLFLHGKFVLPDVIMGTLLTFCV